MSPALALGARLRRHRRLLATAAALVALYTAAGFWIAPALARGQLEQRLSALLHRQVTVERVRMNPYTLSVTVENLRVAAADGSELLGFDRLFVDAKLWPVVRREIGLDAAELVNFRARLVMARDGTLNVDDIVRSLSAPDAKAEETPAQDARPWVFGVDRLAIDRAAIAFEDLSRARPFKTTVGPLTIRLADFRTRPGTNGTYAFDGATDSGERFAWSGSVGTGPLRSTGTLSLSELQLPKYAPYYDGQVGFELRSGTLGVNGRYALEWGPGRRVLTVSEGAVAVRSLALALRGGSAPSLELPAVDVSRIEADLLAGQVEVGAVEVKGGALRVRRGKDGSLDVLAMAGPPAPAARVATGGGRAAKAPAPQPPAQPSASGEGKLRWTVKRLALSAVDVRFDDALPARPVALALAPLDVALTNLTSDRTVTAQLEASAPLNGAGRLRLAGPVDPWKATADLQLHAEGLELAPLDPYLLLYGDLDARLPAGRLGLDGRATVDALAEPLAWTFAGDVRVDDLSLTDAARNEELLRWKGLELAGLRAATKPAPYELDAIRWTEPQVRVRIGPDGSSNLARILRTPPEKPRPAEAPAPDAAAPVVVEASATAAAAPEVTAATTPPATRTATPAAKPPAPSVAYAIGLLRIVRGSVGFVDRSVKPAAVLTLGEVDATVKNLSSEVTARSSVDVRGRVGGAPVEVKGTLSPRMVNDATRLTVTTHAVDLTPLGPYCGKYVGYGLDKGKLELSIGIDVAQRRLKGQNVIKVDQLTLGEKTDSPDATKLPVKLGLAVLQDRDGLIVLDVPVEGNVDDPSFRLNRVIWRAVVNVFVKIVTQPFAVLGALFGGGDAKLDVIAFHPGTAVPAEDAAKPLDTLAKALTSRPGLRLDIEGVATEAADLQALRRQALAQRAREAKWNALASRAGLSGPADLELSDDEYRAFVEAQYRAGLPKPAASPGSKAGAKPPAPPPLPPPEELEAAVLEKIEIPPEALRALAQQRGEAARERLAAAGIDPARLFLTSGGERASREGGPRVYFTLK